MNIIRGCVSCKYKICEDDWYDFCTYNGDRRPISLSTLKRKDKETSIEVSICENWKYIGDNNE